MTPLEILQKTEEAVVERGVCYGESGESLRDVADYWRLYISKVMARNNPRGFSMGPYDVAMMLLLMKVARSQTSPDHKDNHIDMAGYAALAGGLSVPPKD